MNLVVTCHFIISSAVCSKYCASQLTTPGMHSYVYAESKLIFTYITNINKFNSTEMSSSITGKG